MVAALVMTCIICATQAQSNSAYTTVVIEYVGKSDHPSFPIIISTSSADAQWYRHRLFADMDSVFARVYVVQKANLKNIAGIPLPEGDSNSSTLSDVPKTAPTMTLVTAIGHDFKEATIGAEESVRILAEIKKCVSKYPSLIGQLSEIEGRMNRYLQKQH